MRRRVGGGIVRFKGRGRKAVERASDDLFHASGVKVDARTEDCHYRDYVEGRTTVSSQHALWYFWLARGNHPRRRAWVS